MDEQSMLRMLREVLSSRSNVDSSDATMPPRGNSPILDPSGEELPPEAFSPGGGLQDFSAAELRPEGQRYAYDQAMSGYNENMDSMYGGGPDEYEISEPGLRAAEDAEDAARARPYRPNSEESNELYEPGLAEMEASWNDGMSDSDRYLYGPKGWDDPPPDDWMAGADMAENDPRLDLDPLSPSSFEDRLDDAKWTSNKDDFDEDFSDVPDGDRELQNPDSDLNNPGGLDPGQGMHFMSRGDRDFQVDPAAQQEYREAFGDTRNSVTRPNQFAQPALTGTDLPPEVMAWVQALDPATQEAVIAALMQNKR
jgi:hypothetical protein